MDDSGTYENVQLVKRYLPSPSGDAVTTYSELSFWKEQRRIDEDEILPIPSVPSELSSSPRTDAHAQQPKENIGNRPSRKVCILCIFTFVLIAIVVGLSIYVSQIRHSPITCERDQPECWELYQEINRTQRQYRLQLKDLNTTFEASITEISRLALSRSTCLKNISVLNNNVTILQNKLMVFQNERSVMNISLSDLKQAQTDLRQKITDLENKYRTVTEEKVQICQLLISTTEKACPQDWIRNEDRCYFISTLEASYNGSKKYCSNIDGRLLEINSKEEEKVVSNALVRENTSYRIGKCTDREEASSLLVSYSTGRSSCVTCDSDNWRSYCNHQHRFICQRSAHLCTDISERFQDLCQPAV